MSIERESIENFVSDLWSRIHFFHDKTCCVSNININKNIYPNLKKLCTNLARKNLFVF